ncbi:Hypothetical protein, putative [Bodo saltans]|uniref:Uncharacterized protein n=1 Tax=Bodo saltans TaxID=75058 RepID=A0A0S4JTI0_BODSA|nr:Hypothetical protein, putative [Bodo saltans]|eukprot:CUG93688.1 Hypothetical protein, putative [Bodo saltans]
MSSLNARIHPFANRRKASGDPATPPPQPLTGCSNELSTNVKDGGLPSTAPSPPSTTPPTSTSGSSNNGRSTTTHHGRPWAAPILSSSAFTTSSEQQPPTTASPPSALVGAEAGAVVSAAATASPPQQEPPSPFAVSVRLHHRTALRTHDDVRDQFLRCVHLLNLAVSHHHNNESDLSASLTLNSKVVSRLRHHTNIARQQRHATLVNIQPVQLTVYSNGMVIIDPNSVAFHKRILEQCHTLLCADDESGGGVGGGVASMELYYRRGVARAAAARSAIADATSSNDTKRQTAILCSSTPLDLIHILDDDESSALFVFRNPIDAHNAVADICATFLPRILQEVYPEGVLLQGTWRGDEELPASLEEHNNNTTTVPSSVTSTTTTDSSSASSLVWVRQYAPGILLEADHDRLHSLMSGQGTIGVPHQAQPGGGHRLGGDASRRPQDRVLPISMSTTTTEHQASSTCTATFASGKSEEEAPTTAASSGTSSSPLVVVLTPLGRWVFCRRVASGGANETTWDDVKTWVSSELRARTTTTARQDVTPSTTSTTTSTSTVSPSTIRFVIGTVVTGMSSSSSIHNNADAAQQGPIVVGGGDNTMPQVIKWSDAVGDQGVVVRCSWS